MTRADSIKRAIRSAFIRRPNGTKRSRVAARGGFISSRLRADETFETIYGECARNSIFIGRYNYVAPSRMIARWSVERIKINRSIRICRLKKTLLMPSRRAKRAKTPFKGEIQGCLKFSRLNFQSSACRATFCPLRSTSRRASKRVPLEGRG